MNAKLEKKENNSVDISFNVDSQTLENAIELSFKKNKQNFNIPGFRKGKVPRAMIEKKYGVDVFYHDAINFILPEAYAKAVEDLGLSVVSKPEIDIVEIDRNKGAYFTAKITVKPDFEVRNYKEIEFEDKKASVTEDELKKEIDKALEKNARFISVERPAKKHDIVKIDFEGFIDDQAFDGGKAENFELTLGSHSFIDNFEEQIEGHSVSETFDVHVNFPKDYGQEELQGKAAKFIVTINDIKEKELPKADDEFASDISEFETFKEYKDDLKKKLTEQKEKELEKEKEEAIMSQVRDNNEIDIPVIMYENQIDHMLQDFEQNLRMQGMDLEKYSQYTGQSIENIREMYRESAQKFVKTRLILEKIAEAEQIEITDEDIDREIEKMASMYQMDAENIKKTLRKEDQKGIESDLKVQKAFQFILDHAKIKNEVK